MGLEKPSQEEINKMFLNEVSEALGIKEEPEIAAQPKAAELSASAEDAQRIAAARRAMSLDPQTSQKQESVISRQRDASFEDHFWKLKREDMIAELANEIRRISWLDENKTNIDKSIPEINLDLRAQSIRNMLDKVFKTEPGTAKSDEIMNKLYPIWAREWLEAMEAKRDSEVTVQSEPTVAKARTRTMRTEAPVAKTETQSRAAVPVKGEKLERQPISLNEEQKKTVEDLVQSSGIKELKKALEAQINKMDAYEKGRAERQNASAVDSIEGVFRKMVTSGNFPQDKLNYFKQYFLNPQLVKRYQDIRQKGGLKANEALEEHKKYFVESMGGIAKKAGFNEKAVDMIEKYFRVYLLFEKRLYKLINNIRPK